MEDMPGSPFMADIKLPPNGFTLDYDASRVQCGGGGLQVACVNEVAEFTVDARGATDAGSAGSAGASIVGGAGAPELQVSVHDLGTGLPLQVKDSLSLSGVHTYKYTPRTTKNHIVYIVYGDVPAAKSPYHVLSLHSLHTFLTSTP